MTAPRTCDELAVCQHRAAKEAPEPRRTEPTHHLYKGGKYTPAAQTGIRKTLAQFGLVFGGKV